MADGQNFRRSGLESGQGLLPGILDHITTENIFPKLTWETCNALQMVSREWRLAFRSRTVYRARVLSQSTEAFLVLRSEDQHENAQNQHENAVLILYSCKNGTSSLLPRIPVAGKICPFACICLDGRVYLWVCPVADYQRYQRAGTVWGRGSRTKLWVLDLAGERKWRERGQVRCSQFTGVLDGKIYSFRGYTHKFRGSVELPGIWCPSIVPTLPRIRVRVADLPQAEVYEPQSNIWSPITPAGFRHFVTASEADLERHLASFYEWEREKLRMGPSPIIGSYDPFYFEWRSRLSTTLASDSDCGLRNAMDPQVYHRPNFSNLHLFFIREKLVRLVERAGRSHHDLQVLDTQTNAWEGRSHHDLQVLDTQTNAWEHWQSLPAPYRGGIHISSPVFADNVIWTLAEGRFGKAVLMKSTPILGGEADGYSPRWIVTPDSGGPPYGHGFVRPIYL